jgi:tetratricopeptide (TPR) repeat protein
MRVVSSSKPSRNSYALIGVSAVLFAAVVAVFFQVKNFELVDYDDLQFVTRNPHIREGWNSIAWAFKTGYAANWAPLTWISYAVGYRLYGLDAGWHHLTNVLLHALSAVVFFAAFFKMTGARWRSAFVAFAFALHPLHVEAVAWVAERKEVLSGLFWAASLLAWAYYSEKPRVGRFCVVVMTFCFGLLAKPMIVTLPFVLLLVDFWPLGRFRTTPLRRLILEKVPMLALAAIVSVITYLVQTGGGAVSTLEQVPLGVRIENALVSYCLYVAKFVWPANLAVIYPYDSDMPVWTAIGAGLALAAITGLAIRQIGTRPYVAVGWFWFLGTLVPVIGLVQIGLQSRADRYTYIPLIGLAVIAAWGAAELRRPAILAAATAAIGAVWIAITSMQIGYWRDTVALFEHAIQVTDHNWLALSALSHTLIERNRVDEADPYIQEALRLRPNLADTHINSGAALSKREKYTAAEGEYRTAVQLSPGNADAREGLGVVLLEQGRMAEAEENLIAALRIRPDHADTHYNLGRMYGLAGQHERAIAEFQASARLNPENPENHYNLGTALAAAERFEEAAGEFQAALDQNPAYTRARFNLGGALASMGKYDEAIAQFRAVLSAVPSSSEAAQAIEECVRLRSQKRP